MYGGNVEGVLVLRMNVIEWKSKVGTGCFFADGYHFL
jgi:hypothetical protein